VVIPTRRRRLEVLLREADALRKQSILLPRALGTRPVALHPLGDDEDVVFLLHGVLATAGVFAPIETRLRAAGILHIGSFSYQPLRSVASLAAELRREVRNLPPRARLHLVGHSLGGIVARYFAHEHTSVRVVSTISLASPFHGTSVARWVPTVLARELSPSSPLLASLRDPTRQPRYVRHTSFVAADDVVCSPPSSAAFPFGEVIVVPDCGHNGLLFDPGVADAVCARILAQAAEAA